MQLVTDILRGMRDTADHEEEWGDSNDAGLDNAMVTANVLHDVKYSSLVAAYRAEDRKVETQHLSVKVKFADGRTSPMKFEFKDAYRGECTGEGLPKGHVRNAMAEELEYCL